MYPVQDQAYRRPEAQTYATELKAMFAEELRLALVAEREAVGAVVGGNGRRQGQVSFLPSENNAELALDDEPLDPLGLYRRNAIRALADDDEHMARLQGQGIAWGALNAFLARHLPHTLDDRDEVAYRTVRQALDEIFGPQGMGTGWHTFKSAQGKTYVKAGPRPADADGR